MPVLLGVEVLCDSIFTLKRHHVAPEFLWLAARGFRYDFRDITTRLLRSPFGLLQSRRFLGGCQVNRRIHVFWSQNVCRDVCVCSFQKLLVADLRRQPRLPFIH